MAEFSKQFGMNRREFVHSAAAGLLVSALDARAMNGAPANDVIFTKTSDSWAMTNGYVHLTLTRSGGDVKLGSLRGEGGAEWAIAGTPLISFPDKGNHQYRYSDSAISDLAKGGKQLALSFRSDAGGFLTLMFRLYQTGTVIQMATRMENHGQRNLLLHAHLDPLFVTLKSPTSGLKLYSPLPGQQGFEPTGSLSSKQESKDWIVLRNETIGESMFVGGEPGLGVLGWKVEVQPSSVGTVVSAGTILLKDKKSSPPPIFELAPGAKVETPMTFLALARGDADNVGNEVFRYLKQYVFLKPLPNAPWVTYNIWLTETDAEDPILKEMDVAKRMGFDLFYLDASWYQGASVIPGMNDWTLGLGTYRESLEKFPHGIRSLSDKVHAKGMKFGIWVDAGNVDAARVESGEISRDQLAMIDGKTIGSTHPSLALTKQLCMGDPAVSARLAKQLGDTIEKWNLDWVKWDPSATVSYECNRTDHGHGRTDGAYAAYQGRLEILRYLIKRFPNLSGFECDPSLEYSRINPGPVNVLPGGYTNEFITGPMVSPNVWGSLATGGKLDAKADLLTARWYSASALDYNLRKHFMHGVTFGTVNGMSSQFLSAAPPGYQEAFRRNLLYFKQYRHLLFHDVYHPKLGAAGWSSLQYVKADATESVVFVFRDKSDTAGTNVQLRGLDPRAKYRVTSLNDRPGRDRIIEGDSLMKGISVRLPNEWLAAGDGGTNKEFAEQTLYGSDILMLTRLK